MKEMKYEKDRKLEVLQDKEYKGYRYIILSLGTHPTAYIEIPKGHHLCGWDYDDIDINVHGGLTYARHELMGIDSENWYIGWDYAHAGDYYAGGYYHEGDKKWTTKEIENECRRAINELIDKYDQEKDIDIPLIPEDELHKFNVPGDVWEEVSVFYKTKEEKLDYNFKVLQEKLNELIKEFNEFRKEDK